MRINDIMTARGKKIAAATVAACALFTAGCAGGAEAGSEASPSSTVTIQDQRGQDVTVAQPVERIATAVIPSPAIIAAVDGSWDKIVGINESTLKANQEGIIGKIFPESMTTEVVSTRDFTPDMEKILGLNPDVMIQWGTYGEDKIAPIEQAGIPMLGLKYGTQADLEKWVTMFGQMLGKEDRAGEIIGNMDSEAKKISEKVAAIDGPSPRALSLSYSSEKLSVSNGDDYAQHVYDLTGVTNVAKDSQVTDGVVDAEQIIEWDPEIIFLSAFDAATPEDVYNDPRFQGLSAVKEKRVYRSPLGVYRWQVPCAESPLFWNWVAALAYPGEFEVDLPELTREQTQFLYNYELSDGDIEHILRTDLNGGSANYDAVSK